MKILFNLNLEKENTKQCTEQAVSILEQAGAECFLEYGMASVFDDSYHYADKEATMADFDLIVAVGGDGTIMDVGKQAALYDKPVLGCQGEFSKFPKKFCGTEVVPSPQVRRISATRCWPLSG